MYIIMALLSAVTAAARRAGEKQISHSLNHFTIGWSVQLFSLPITLIALVLWGNFYNPFSLGMNFWLPVLFMWIGFYPLNTFLYINAIKIGEMSRVMPLQSLGPVLALLFGWAFLKEQPSLQAVVGIFIIVLAVYVLNLKGKYLHNPFKIFVADKASLYTISFLTLGTGVGVLDKIAIKASDPIYFSFVCTLGAVISLLVTSIIFRVKEYTQVARRIVPLSILGTLFGASFITYLLALSSGPLAYVNTLRSASLLIGTAIGIVYFKEVFTKSKKYALTLIVIGSIVLMTA